MEAENIPEIMHIVQTIMVIEVILKIYKQSSRGLSNITHQPLLESQMRTHNNKHIVYVGKSNRTPHPRFLELQIHANPRHADTFPTRNIQLPNFVIHKIPSDLSSFPHHKLRHLVLDCIKLKDIRHNRNNLSF